jgi:hypothetical protein
MQDVARYDDLRERSGRMPILLVVLFLPPDAARWLEHSEEGFLARRCAYWVSLWDAPASKNQTGQTAHQPKGKALSVEALRRNARTLFAADHQIEPPDPFRGFPYGESRERDAPPRGVWRCTPALGAFSYPHDRLSHPG